MQRYLQDEKTLNSCKIYQMLLQNNEKKHLSFHTPGHKNSEWDITELSYSDNLSAPLGCIASAQAEIAEILGAARSFLLTDGSTSGVLSTLYVAKELGVKKIALSLHSHKSVFNGCKLMGLTPLVYDNEGTMYEMNAAFEQADALFFTSPDYYGKVKDLKKIREYCDQTGKLFLVDGAHGGHLHFDKAHYAGVYADLWVDGVHKSLPAFTQGAVVSARTRALGEKLQEAVDIFRTTSPSYPIMASVEYAVKFPRNEELERRVVALQQHPRIIKNEDWTKLCAQFGARAFEVERQLESEGIFPEFCDGEWIVFYLSPAMKLETFEFLKNKLLLLFEQHPYQPSPKTQRIHTPLVIEKDRKTEWVNLEESEGRICANQCGLFPPCVPLLTVGDKIGREQIEKLKKASNVFGIQNNQILVLQ